MNSRPGEVALVATGVCNLRYTPDLAGLAANPEYYDWIENGFRLYEACTNAGLDVIECFPTASWTRLFEPRRGQPRGAWTSAALRSTGLRDVPHVLNQHRRDAIGAALTARATTLGKTEAFGDIVVVGYANPCVMLLGRIRG